MAGLRVLELYSGMGGMHCGLTASGAAAEVVAAIDVNTTANEVYKYNFPSTPLWPKSIEIPVDRPNRYEDCFSQWFRNLYKGIALKELDSLSFDMILMSPPCQPFTWIGLQGDVSDPRAKSFLYVLEVLPRLQKTPKYILLENVKGFESSEARGTLIKTLQSCGYHFQEFLLSPPCLGIPNSRLRYFLIAKLQSEPFAFQTTNKILETFPTTNESQLMRTSCDLGLKEHSQTDTNQKQAASSAQCPEEGFVYKLETAEELERKQSQDNDCSVQTLQEFLEENTEEISQYLLPSKSLLRYALILDIVKPTCRRSTCFTKGYGHYVEGTGSVLQMATDVEMSSVYKSLETLSDEEKLAQLTTMKLRYFTPREIVNLHGFPSEFGFPEKITVKQRYRLLGNSLNVHIVARLITLLLQTH